MSKVRNYSWIAMFLIISMLSVSLFAGGQQDKKGTENEPVELIWYQYVGQKMPDEELVFDELNKYLAEKIGAVVKPYFFTYEDFNSKMPVILASGQPFDICFTSGWTNQYLPNVAKDAFMPLDELLENYGSETKEFIPEALWNAVKVNDNIYGIPVYKEVGHQFGFFINKEMAERNDLDLTSIKDFWDIEPMLEKISISEENVIGWYGSGAYESALPIEHITGDWNLPGALNVPGLEAYANQKPGKVFNQYATPEFREFVEKMWEYNQKGYSPKNAVEIVNDSTIRDEKYRSGQLFSSMLWYAPLAEMNYSASTDVETAWVPAMPPVFESSDAFGGLQAISSNSQFPEKAMAFLNLLNTDPKVATMIRHGIEGVHYELVDGQADMTATGYEYSNHPYNYGFGWMFGSPLKQIWDTTYPAEAAEAFLAYNETTIPTGNLGFSFDVTPVQNEVSALQNVASEYLLALTTGSVNPDEFLPRFLEKLEANGVDRLIAEVQKQLDSYNAAK